MHSIAKAIHLIFLIPLLFACTAISQGPASTAVVETGTALPAEISPGEPIPASTSSVKFFLDNLRMTYVVDGNLWVQHGGDVPVQLTYSEGDGNPRFSQDGERILFYRNPEPFTYHILDLYSIHADGTEERMLVTGSLLENLGFGYNQFTEIAYSAFVPDTHQVLFRTNRLNEEIARDLYRVGAQSNLDLLSVHMDTGEIKIILPPGKGGNFVISPDGSMIAVQSTGRIDVVSIDGHMIRQNLVTYTPSAPYELLPGMFWSNDSTELLVTLPVDTVYEIRKDACNMDAGVRNMWRYPMDGGAGVQIHLDPPPMGGSEEYQISPDRNWILYPHYYFPGCGGDENVRPGLYLGNLREGTAQLYDSNAEVLWSTDNMHFIYDIWEQGMFLGSIKSPPVLMDHRFDSLGWINSTYYFSYYIDDGSTIGVIGEINGEISNFSMSVPGSILDDTARSTNFDFIYIYP